MTVPSGLRVTIYKNGGLNGESKLIQGPAQIPDFLSGSLLDGWNDKICSMAVSKSGYFNVQGSW